MFTGHVGNRWLKNINQKGAFLKKYCIITIAKRDIKISGLSRMANSQ